MVDKLERGKHRKVRRILTCCVAGEELDGDKNETLCLKDKGGGHEMHGEVLQRSSTNILR